MKQITHFSILITVILLHTGCSAGTGIPGAGQGQNRSGKRQTSYPPEILISQNFDHNSTGTYTLDAFHEDWGDHIYPLGIEDGTVEIIQDSDRAINKAMAIYYPADSYNNVGNGKTQFKVKLNDSYDNLYCSYKVKFEEGFDFVKGGKLPGLAGGDCNVGGNKPDGYDGFSTRAMWRSDNRLVSYVYHPDQTSWYGEDFSWGQVETGVWYHIEMHVLMNTPGEYDGVLEVWIDGTKVLEKNDFRFRDTDAFAIDTFYFSSFFGGSDPSWAAAKDEYVYFDDIIVSTYPITH